MLIRGVGYITLGWYGFGFTNCKFISTTFIRLGVIQIEYWWRKIEADRLMK